MISLPRFSLILAIATSLAACGSSPEAQFARAREAFSRHDYTAAKLDLADLAERQPGNIAAQELLARTYIELGDAEGARKAVGQLAKVPHPPADLPQLQGETELLNARFDAALKALAALNSADAERVRALAYLGLNRRDEAAAAFARGVSAQGDRSRLLADFAHFRLAQGDVVEARRLAALSARAKPRPLASYLATGDVQAASSELGNALKTFDQALQTFPQSRAALIGKTHMLDALGRKDEARALVAEALSQDPDDPTLLYLDARADALDGKWSQVRDKLQARERLLDQQPDANALYARALLKLGQAEQARVRLSSQLLRSPADRRVRLLLGETELALNNPSAAVETLKPFATLAGATGLELGLLSTALRATHDPLADTIAQRARGAAGSGLIQQLATADKAMRGRDWPTAIHEYEQILAQTDGRNVLVLNNLAFAYDQAGNRDRALQFAERALKLAPDQPSVMDTAGWLLHRTGKDKARAKALLQGAAKGAPKNPTIRDHLAQVEAA